MPKEWIEKATGPNLLFFFFLALEVRILEKVNSLIFIHLIKSARL